MCWSEALTIGKSQNDLWCQRSQNESGCIAQERVPQPIDALEMLEQQDKFLDMIRSQVAILIVERMRNGVANAALCEITLQLEDVFSELLNISVLRFGQIPQEQMNVDMVVRKLSRNLLTEKRIRKLCDFAATIDPIVVGKRDKGHPFLFHPLIQLLRIGIAVWKFESAKNPLSRMIAEFGVNMEVDFRGHTLEKSCCHKPKRKELTQFCSIQIRFSLQTVRSP
jgi:hypothetical protein